MKQYTKFDDPGHGWLRVEASELIELGIADKISSCSYMYGKWAYLEEDCDMTIFYEAKGWIKDGKIMISKEEHEILVSYNCDDSNERIRNFPHYSLERIQPLINSIMKGV